MKKFELTSEFIDYYGRKLFRIKALIDFKDVKIGDLGGFVEKEDNLSHDGNSWVFGNAKICDNAQVFGNAKIFSNANIYGKAKVYGDAKVYSDANIFGNAKVYGITEIHDNAKIFGYAKVFDNACVYDNAWICGGAWIFGNAWVSGNAKMCGNAWVFGNASVCDNAKIYGNACISDGAYVCGDALIFGNADYTTIKGFGSRSGSTTTFFRCKDKTIRVRCGCFYGTIPEFRDRVNKTRNGKIAKEYLMIADLMEMHFKEGN